MTKMAVSLKAMIARETPRNQRAIRVRATVLIEHEANLRALRKAMGKTQVDVAATLGIKQENVSRIERQTDLLLSTLRRYVRAIGGNLRVAAEFSDGRMIDLPEFTDLTLSRGAVRSAGLRTPGAGKRAASSPGRKRSTSSRSGRKASSTADLHVD